MSVDDIFKLAARMRVDGIASLDMRPDGVSIVLGPPPPPAPGTPEEEEPEVEAERRMLAAREEMRDRMSLQCPGIECSDKELDRLARVSGLYP